MKIHLHSKQGLYTVVHYNSNTILVETKNSSFRTPVSDFKSLAGGSWNFNVSKEEQDKFLNTVAPKIIETAKAKTDVIIKHIETLQETDEAIEDYYNDPANYMDDESHYDYSEEDYKELYDDEFSYDYEELYNNANKELISLQQKMNSIAKDVYSHNLNFDYYQNWDGTKFIIQYNSIEERYRFRWDPFKFRHNFHSAISDLYSDTHWPTVNGGHIRVINNDVILYGKSGDYGVYEDKIAIEAVKEIFSNKNIYSYAGRHWDDELTDKFMQLPF